MSHKIYQPVEEKNGAKTEKILRKIETISNNLNGIVDFVCQQLLKKGLSKQAMT